MSAERIAVVGLGYVGLPVALSAAQKFPLVQGFDVNSERIAALRRGVDVTNEGFEDALKGTSLRVTATAEELSQSNFFIVAVPTPVHPDHTPDLTPVERACATIGSVMRPGSVVVFESTVYPGLTEEFCVPLLEKSSKLTWKKDFFVGYSPERINPGDKEHTLESIVKVVAGDTPETLERVAAVYSKIVKAGVYRASSIKVAEAAKVLENTQRDLNIALMNELAIICDKIGIRTRDVLDAAGTKWNFLKFSPGLVGGHCIGVDPYYLTAKAEQLGYHPEVILAGRRINDGMGAYIAQRMVKLMVHAELPVKGARVGILGITFKENVADIRNSRVPDIIHELRQFGVQSIVHDPQGDSHHIEAEYGIKLAPLEQFRDLDALVLAVNHREFVGQRPTFFTRMLKRSGVFVDVKSVFSREHFAQDAEARADGPIHYWSL